jgi:hypothetical protein
MLALFVHTSVKTWAIWESINHQNLSRLIIDVTCWGLDYHICGEIWLGSTRIELWKKQVKTWKIMILGRRQNCKIISKKGQTISPNQSNRLSKRSDCFVQYKNCISPSLFKNPTSFNFFSISLFLQTLNPQKPSLKFLYFN